MIVVQKYGGSSLTDVERIGRVADRVVGTVQGGDKVVAVVSAMGNTTNELLALARKVTPNPQSRELDMLISVGERVSMTLLAMAVAERGVRVVSFTGSQSGIITDTNHARARVVEVRPQRIAEALEEHDVVIVAGFQGVSHAREVTTLGRGGSDTTAVVLAAALGAEHCEICSDVDGVYSADPRVVPEAVRLDELPLDAALALAQGGAKVLLADALAFAREQGVTLRAAATSKPGGTGTRLPPGPPPEDVVGIAARANAELFELSGDVAELGLPVAAALSTGETALVVVDLANVHDREGLQLGEGIHSRGAVCTVSAVGRSVVSDPTVMARAIAACSPLGMVGWLTAEATWTAILPPDAVADAQRDLHRFLVDTGER